MRPPSIHILDEGPLRYDVLPTDLRQNKLFNLQLAALNDIDDVGQLSEVARFRLVDLPLELLEKYIIKDLAQYLEEGDLDAVMGDLDHTLSIVKLLQKNADLPPVVIHVDEDSGAVELLDGYHRLTAHYHAGRMGILAYETLTR